MTGAMRRRTVKIRYPDRQIGFAPPLKYGPTGVVKYTELILVRRFDADHRIGSRTYTGGYIRVAPEPYGGTYAAFALYSLCHGIEETIFRKCRHLQTLRGIYHTLRHLNPDGTSRF